ncbi:MAG TPA: response regulator, partial [Candidatus Udaeobacter sp.]|nr:response regulator [Candidatus Udaeobacter sp.]
MRDRVNILVVDDLPAQRLTIEASLSDLGENVVCMSSGREALKFLLQNDAAVILLDVNMPGMDGFETAALIRQRPRTANTPIIFLTADPDEMQIARGYALGAVDYLVCPFVPDVLSTKVKVFVTLSREHERLRVEAEQRVELTREQAARAAAEDQSRRLRVLVEAGGVLTRSLHGAAFESELLALLIPDLADQAGIVYPESGPYRGDSVWMRGGPGETTEPAHAPPSELREPVARVLATGIAEPVHPIDAGGMLAMVWPLDVRGEVQGALAVSRFDSRRPYLAGELELIELMSHRTSIVVENRRLYAALRERDQRKDEFLATLSHELRNPLGAITTASQVLQLTGPGAGPALHASQVIARQSVHLARLVDDLLEVSRVTAGRIQLNREHFDLCDVVRRAVDALASTGKLAPYQVSFAGESVMIDADLARTDQVITNLLINAVKYTDPGGRISVEVAKDGPHARV